MSDKQLRKAKQDIVLPNPEYIPIGKKHVEMIAFKHQLSDDFPIEFSKKIGKL